ncbi:HhH-GPD family protein [Companilactobacillus mindensis DSM 14500]|uniref:DNA-3-methyladenine glycosylase II n=1 Tax=Companilactobacillus mindensis DSM 14500 TaxID=1423770 RepID=A0A0R1QEG1_9LACO|nr:DNA-3-methyladenine glycosylase [Companilactobacillus mindensis]KRL43199.1 HhH-GPD family protein [Companilactobacillus mindensis DSM 14500]GEO78159.1 DNA-3-methyladenine glycosylase [Companilactobacillus mindensis]
MLETKHFDEESPEIKYLCQKDKHLAKAIKMIGPLDYQVNRDGYAFLVSQIIGQMLSNKVADVLTQRLTNDCQGHISITSINSLSDEDIRAIGISHSKVNYIRNLTEAIVKKDIDFAQYQTMNDVDIIKDLTTVKGIGNWSAKMYLLFVLDRPDILPFEDVAFLQGYGWIYKTTDYKVELVKKKCKKWHPYSSLAARYMYKVLDSGLTKEEFHLFK